MWNGQVIMEVRAKLADVMLDVDDPAPAPPPAAEPEPEDDEVRTEQRTSNSPAPASTEAVALPTSVTDTSHDVIGERAEDTEPDIASEPLPQGETTSVETETVQDTDVPGIDARWIELFGDEIAAAIAAGEPVKLDPSVDRAVFREQRTVLRQEFDYDFKASSQTWYKQ
jgi:hypothetical protein